MHFSRDFQSTYDYMNDEPVAGNYYPVNAEISISDTVNGEVAVLTDRSSGGWSPGSGQMELMVR